jgi:DNA-binding IclR family transcriptional regulator
MVIAAIDISGPSSAFDGLDKAKLIADVQRAARALSGRLGAQVK